ncbi:PilZ domain-containing protein [Alteraurantiacibacter buctensis]|uniref:PilZ domain-containing protein n=1 Tax=Alteraurantiacibacter buctensis TaxID=1503981 RepID=A0A844YWK6_9SPHN|nr:PilZ domain-containing protein [Alteraurantiacibacter buctensis]MXO71211.1 PilZ domain-containing protein [Alteraurantiacibacter buctensis]
MDMGSSFPSATGRRRDSRLRIRQGVPAQAMTLDGQLSASVLDLSQSGAHLRLSEPLRTGQDVMLWWLGFEAFGRVVWVSGSDAGLEFYDLVPAPVLLHTREQVDAGRVRSTDEVAIDAARAWYQGWR